MRRGDVVVVAAPGDYGKPRPAIIVQSDVLPPSHHSVVVCQMTSTIVEAPHLRITVDPGDGNGLLVRSQIMADKPVTLDRKRIGRVIGRLSEDDMAKLDMTLAFVMGLGDR